LNQPHDAIDIVYLWVDGNDSVWRAKRCRAASQLSASHRDAMAQYGDVEGRYRDNDELRYNLRALEKFFPAHGHIYVVTDAQTPAWLRSSDRLTVVDHRDLIPAAHLPTFDSSHIESYIHRIPGLSERYFYLNDDVMFGAQVSVDNWFFDGGFYVAWSDEPPVSDEPPQQNAGALENACRLSGAWFKASAQEANAHNARVQAVAQGYEHVLRTFAHSPRPMRKSVLFELENLAPDMFNLVRSTVFRTWDKPPIVCDFVLRWALATGLAKVRDYAHLYVSSGAAEQSAVLESLVKLIGKVEFFCINDTTDDAYPHDPRLTEVREALQRMFPQPSSFERVVAA
jgi:Stealth protein CR2, conserved region 2/Stealth protein CR1, conserved region 1/Stealth protein CR4, conserved region 4